MGKGYLLGVDIGTYSSKGVLVDENGSIVASAVIPHEVEMPRPGHFEHDAEKVWWGDFITIVWSLLAQSAVEAGDILAVGVSGIGPCVLPVDDRGKPLRRAILYGIDTRAVEEIAYLEEVLGRDAIFEACGTHLDSQTAGPKILWIQRHEPEVYARTRFFLTSQGYLVYRLTGVPSLDIYTAAGYAPLFDVHRLSWHEEFARPVVSLSSLPQLFWSIEVVGKVTEEAAQETGLITGTPVIAGTTDAAAEAVSVGVHRVGDMMLMLGSSAFFIVKTPELVRTERFWSAPFLEPGTCALLGGMSTAGSLTKWFRDQFAFSEVQKEEWTGKDAYEILAEYAAHSPRGARGLVALPYFEGERTPLRDPKARGLFFGLRLEHTRGDIYRALLEGVGFGIRHNLETMGQEGVKPERIFVAGGGTKNPLWMRIIADITGARMIRSMPQVGASYGDAFLAGVGIGLFSGLGDITRWVQVTEVIEPAPEGQKEYAPYYRLFLRLYEVNRSLMHELASIIQEGSDRE